MMTARAVGGSHFDASTSSNELSNVNLNSLEKRERDMNSSVSTEMTAASSVVTDSQSRESSPEAAPKPANQSADYVRSPYTSSLSCLPEHAAAISTSVSQPCATNLTGLTVARMPNQEDRALDIPPEVLKIAQEIQAQEQEEHDLYSNNQQEQHHAPDSPQMQDRKPAARPTRPTQQSSCLKDRSPSKSPKPAVSFAALPLPPGKPVAPELLQDDSDNEETNHKKPARNTENSSSQVSVARPPSLKGNRRARSEGSDNEPRTRSNSPTNPRAKGPGHGHGPGLGLRGRKKPQTQEDRENRRKEIMRRTGSLEEDNVANVLGENTNPNNNNNHQNNDAVAMEPVSCPLTLSEVRTPNTTTNNNTATPLPGDTLAGAPGDNLASQTQTNARPTTRRINRGALFSNSEDKPSANPPASAYAQPNTTSTNTTTNTNNNTPQNDSQAPSDHSEKQRARRQDQDNLPSNFRPGAYKEIPGRGLVRNNTLRFSVMNSIANQKKSLRKMFSSRRGANFLNDNSYQSDSCRNYNNNEMRDSSNNSNSNSNNGSRRNNFLQRMTSGRSMRSIASGRSAQSIPSVLVEDSFNASGSYLGNVSLRSLNNANNNGLCVARPVLHREASTMEALCIIPGDLAVAVALDEQINVACQSNTEARLHALQEKASHEQDQDNDNDNHSESLSVSPKRDRKKSRLPTRVAKMLLKTPKKLVNKPKNYLLKPFRRGKQQRNQNKKSSDSGGDRANEMNMITSTGILNFSVPPEEDTTVATRRHSF